MPSMPVSALYTNSYHYHLLLTTHTVGAQRRETAVQLQTLETVWQGLCGLARLSGKSILDCGFREQRHGDGSESGIGTVSCPY